MQNNWHHLNFLFMLKTVEIPKRQIRSIHSIGHNGCFKLVDVVSQLMLSDSPYFQTGDAVRQPLLSDSHYGQTLGQYRL
jgi:hypothetical protein